MDLIKRDLETVSFPACKKCGVKLTDENWYPSLKKKHYYICKKCNDEHAKKWQQNNRDRYNQLMKKWRQNNRDRCNQRAKIWQQNNKDRHNQLANESNHRLINEVIDAYGGKCACCGETRKEYLSIDHIDGNGNKHRRKIGVKDSMGLYRWLRRNNYPEGFQVLCFNCNMGKGNFSVCPHNREIFEKEFEAKLKESYHARWAWALRLEVIK